MVRKDVSSQEGTKKTKKQKRFKKWNKRKLLHTSPLKIWIILDRLISNLSNLLVTINIIDSMIVGRTTSMPKSALCYELDKARYPNLETCSTPVLFYQKKRRSEESEVF